MPPQSQRSLSWREKRKSRGPTFDAKKKTKADRERFRRGRAGSFKRLNDLYLDGVDTGRERRVYVVVSSKTKGPHGSVRYSTYNSHPNDDWVPLHDEVLEHWPKTDQWTPESFGNDKEQSANKSQHTRSSKRNRSPGRLFTVSKPPLLNLPQTPTLT
ncbi:hypothetical protein BO71DRAFT_398842 [Aspergillus ellipticus CBS 707.79]|uniref:Uncharacterized protein n=1 Tax=Aspergillus ellipticus CBS 707.79 TaxID=1448320 RepID=A0A319DT39_9EURO|nr:hypothetical protein BO71DRAFT_398842 [Aspergillus ellipticus CBS 707.79]